MTLRLVIFDVDGTLVDSQADILAAMGAAFALLFVTLATAVAGGLLARSRMQLFVFSPAMLGPATLAVMALIAAAMLPALTLPATLCLAGVAAVSLLDAWRHRD